MPGTVTVACKLPHGLQLQLQKSEEISEVVMGGGSRKVTRWEKIGKTVTIKGWAHHAEKAPGAPISGGFALTSGVDADFFEEWLKQNASHPAVENGFIFASAKQADVESHTKLCAKDMTGFEPHDPQNPTPEFKRRIETAVAA
ncbi:MAG TPA: hypothetical protein VHP34_11615 [Alphaproteobacteria bacterium]|nr:hypothetical protein [Alphaproteobacteria bacterium]